jgi:hypothetical protein
LTSILCLVNVGQKTYTREIPQPILRYSVPPPQHSNSLEDSSKALVSTGMNMVTFLILSAPHIHTTKNLVIYDDFLMTFLDLVIDHTTSMTNSQILS